MATLTRLIALAGPLVLALVVAAPAVAGTRPAPAHAPGALDLPCGNLNVVTRTWDIEAGRPAALRVLADDCPGSATAARPLTIMAVTTKNPFVTGTYARVSTDGRSIFYNPIGCTRGDGGSDYVAYTISDGTTTATGYEVVHLNAPPKGTAPRADTPDAAFIAGATVGSTVPMRLTWCGIAATDTSLSSYRLYQSTDGGATYPSSTSSSTTSVTRSLKPGTAYRWRMAATDKARRTGTKGEASAVSRITAYADTSSKIRYSSGWTSARSTKYLGGREKQATRAGATATLSVANVRQFAIVGTRGPGRGSLDVYVDGKRVRTVSERTGSTIYRRVLYVGSIPGDTAATHTIMLRATSRSRVGLDGIYTLSGRGTPDLAFTGPVPAAARVQGPTDGATAATASGLPVGVTLATASWPACSLTGTTVAYHGRGTCTLSASVPADTAWNARTVTRAYPVAGIAQSITFGALADATYGDPDRPLAATSTSGLAVAFASRTPTVCAVDGTTASILAAGTCTIRATQAGSPTDEPAPPVDRSFAVARIALAVTGITAADKTYDGTTAATLSTTNAALVGVLPGDAVTLVTTGATGTFASAGAGVGKLVTVAGLVLAGADAADYTVTPPTDTADIARAPQSITVTSPQPSAVKGGPAYAAAATATSNLPVTYSVAATPPGTCTAADNVIQFADSGQCAVQFDQAGDANWLPAPRKVQVLTVASTGSTPQAITFDPLAGVTYGGAPVPLTASSSSGLGVTFASLDPDICTVSGATATLVAAGTCHLQASQAGDPTYLPATPVTQGLVVAPRAITVTAVPVTKTYDGTTSATGTPTIGGAGLASGDTASFVQAFATPTVGTNKPVIPSGTVSRGAANVTASYTIAFVAANVGTIDAGPAATLVVSGLASTAAGTAQTFTVAAHDAFGNVATGYRGTVAFSSTDPAATLPPEYPFTAADGGVHTFAATLRTAGTRTVTATDTVSPSITGSQSSLTISAAAASTIDVSAGASQRAGTPFEVVVTMHDAFGNLVQGYNDTVALGSSDPAASLVPASHHFNGSDHGTFTFTPVTLRTAGPQTITATATAPAITGTSGQITVAPEAADHLVVVAGTSQAAGTPFTVTVTARDGFGNRASGYRGTVGFTSTDAQAALPPAYAFTSGDGGEHAFTNGATLGTVGTASITVTDPATPSITGTQAGIAVAAGAATHLQVAGFGSTVTAGVAGSVTVTAKDGFGNTVTGYAGTVSITSNDPNPALPPATALTNGTRSFAVTLRTAGVGRSITASDGSISGSQAGITVNPAGAATLLVEGYPTPTTAGVAHPVSVTARDAFGNTATGYTGTVAFSSSDPAATGLPASATFVAGDGGTRSFGGIALRTAGGRSITATDTVTATITGTQAGITVQPAEAQDVAIMTAAGGGTVVTTLGVPSGTARTVYANSLDAFGNVIGNVSVAWSLTAMTGGVLDGELAPASGTSATFTGALVGTAVIAADDGAGHTDTTGTVTVTPGPASVTTSTVAADQPSIAADGLSTATITVRLRDAAGNDLEIGGADVTLDADHGSLGPVTDHADGGYTATYTSDTTAGVVTVTAALAGVPLATTATLRQE